MSLSSIVSSTNPRRVFPFVGPHALKLRTLLHYAMIGCGLTGLICGGAPDALGQTKGKEPIEMSVVAVNPSNSKTQVVPIKMYLPQEVTPDAIIDAAGLNVEFDAAQSMYYLYKDAVELKPAETKMFNVEIKDVWIIPQGRLDSLADQAASVIKRLEGSEFYDSANLLGETIYKALKTVSVTQNDDSVSRKSHIGIYRKNLQIIEQIKEDIARLEKQLVVASSLPKPDVLEQAKLKTDSPTKNTSWMIIFIIMLFIGMLAAVFFFTWQTQARATKNLISEARESAFPKRDDSQTEA